jgi:hypothetical protein
LFAVPDFICQHKKLRVPAWAESGVSNLIHDAVTIVVSRWFHVCVCTLRLGYVVDYDVGAALLFTLTKENFDYGKDGPSTVLRFC